MDVPLTERKPNPAAYLRDTRLVFTETARLMKKMPRSRDTLEWQRVMDCAYEAYQAASDADAIWVATLAEARDRIDRLNRARGRVNALAGMADGWMEHPPQVVKRPKPTDMEGARGQVRQPGQGDDRYENALSDKQIQNYLMTCAKALHSLKRTLGAARDTYRNMLQQDMIERIAWTAN